MLLTGSLEAFRVQDILGLVTRKPGQWLITLSGGPRGRRGFIGVRDRSVVSASADSGRQDLARRLVIRGAVGTTGLSEALRHAGDGGLVPALVDSDRVDPGLIEECVREHLVSSIAALTHWRTGSFSVDGMQQLTDDVGVVLPVTRLGVLVTQLLQKWRPASDQLGGPGTVFAPHPGEVAPRLRGLHSLIDGHRSVAELVVASGHGEVGAVVDLAELLANGCATPVTGSMGALEQRLAMLSALETPESAARPTRTLSVIPGGAQGGPSGAAEQGRSHPAPGRMAGSDDDTPDDLLTMLLRGVRGV